MASVFK